MSLFTAEGARDKEQGTRNIIHAGSMDETVQIAQNYPDFDYGGSVQVRQVMKMDL